MRIIGLQKFSLLGYPEHFSCVILFGGCNWRCPWCNAFDFVNPFVLEKKQELPKKRVLDFLKKQYGKLNAIVLSGGEPTINKELPKFCKQIKKIKYKIKLDTNGSNPEMLGNLINNNLVDYIAMDIKAPKEKYSEAIGFKGSSREYLMYNLEKSIDLIKKSGIDYEFTTTFHEQLNKYDILRIANWIKPAKKYFLQLSDDKKDNNNPHNLEYQKTLFSVQNAIAPFFNQCEIR